MPLPFAPVETDDPAEAAHRARRSQRVFMVAIVVAASWGLALATLALVTANPITLNPAQIENAHFVVTATVSVEQPGNIVVSKEWKRDAKLGTIVVENLRAAKAAPGEEYLLPLTRVLPDRYRVTDFPKEGLPPLIYPAVPDAERQLGEILGRRARPE